MFESLKYVGFKGYQAFMDLDQLEPNLAIYETNLKAINVVSK